MAPTVEEQAKENGILVETVEIHKSPQVMPLLEGLDLDLIVFGGTRIIRGEILEFPRHVVVNSHP